MYFQALFILDRVKALSATHPEWKTQEPYAALLKGDMRAVAAGGENALLQVFAFGLRDWRALPALGGELLLRRAQDRLVVSPATLNANRKRTPASEKLRAPRCRLGEPRG